MIENNDTYKTKPHKYHRGKIHFLTFEIYRSENDFYCGHSYIACYDEQIRFNGKTNDRCAADRSGEHQLGGVYKCKWEVWNILMSSNRYSHVSCATRDIIRCVMCLAQYARLVYYSDILLMSVSDYSYCIHVHVWNSMVYTVSRGIPLLLISVCTSGSL